MFLRYSKDLRNRVVAAVEEDGLSRRAAAKRFRISVATTVRWCQQSSEKKLALKLALMEGRESRRAQDPVGLLYDRVFDPCALSINEIRERFAERGHVLGNSKAWLPCRRDARKSKGYPVELRNRVVAAIEAGLTRRAAAARFGVSVATAGRWHRRFRETGSVEPLPMGGDRRSGRAQSVADTVKGWIDEQPAITIAEIRERLEAQGHALGYGTVWRLLVRKGYTVKKITVFAGEQNRKDVKIKRRQWKKNQKALSAFRLIFVDEFSVNTKMARTRGRALRGKRCVTHIPHGHWKSFTVVAALGPDGILHFMVFDGAMTGKRFRIWIKALAKKLRPGDLVICDNLAAHKVSGLREILEEKGADIRYLPAYSPDLNPIEKAISQLKSHLRKVEARTVDDLHAAVKVAANRVTAIHARNHFVSCGYEIHAAT